LYNCIRRDYFFGGLFYTRLPSSFLPAEDQGYFITNIQLPVGAAQERTDEVLRQVEEYFLQQPENRELHHCRGI